MSDLFKVTIKPDNIIMYVPSGTLISKILYGADIQTEMPCGGIGKCGKCKVVATGILSEITEQEKQVLTDDMINKNIRFACLTKVMGDSHIYIPDDSRYVRQNILTFSNTRDVKIVNDIRKININLKEPKLGDDASEYKRLFDFIKENYNISIKSDINSLYGFSRVIRDAKYNITVILKDDYLIGVEAGDTSSTSYGIAYDIGSTTLAGYLLDLNTGDVLAVSSLMNPHIMYGDDLISRINFISNNENGLEIMHQIVWESLSKMANNMAKEFGISVNSIYKATIVGNTCMCHIAMGLDPFTLGVSPYIPGFSDSIDIEARRLGLHIHPNGRVCFLPCIAGFVGADTVGVILSEMPRYTGENILAVDIGTNGEMALWYNNKLTVCSAAAGPAFEGAGISSGMRGGKSAIDKVFIENGDIHCRVIGDVPASGICGSGLIDAVSKLVELGVVDMTGRLVGRDEFIGSEAIKERIIDGRSGNEFILVYAKDTRSGYDLTLKHSDIRSLQLAKGSIHAAIKTLLSVNGIDESNLSKILIAGGFGNYLSVDSAVAIGLLPDIGLDKIISVGNAAGSGARLALVSSLEMEMARKIAISAEHIELALSSQYQMNLMDCMMFE